MKLRDFFFEFRFKSAFFDLRAAGERFTDHPAHDLTGRARATYPERPRKSKKCLSESGDIRKYLCSLTSNSSSSLPPHVGLDSHSLVASAKWPSSRLP